MSRPNDATLAQIRAADPTASTWVSANAGSGKTRVLTDRVARLLLQNVPPGKILCLTYTKAAASHMQTQLFARLGEWAMLPDGILTQRLADLGEDTASVTADFLRHARTLFARALETPGGLKIQTIHSFCASLLRRFPLEAGVSPQFQEMDERSGKKLREDILERLADGPTRAAFDAMATYLSGDDPDKFIRELVSNRNAFARRLSQPEIWATLDLPKGYDEAEYLRRVLPDWAGEVLPDLQTALQGGKANDLKNAAAMDDINWRNPAMDDAIALETMFVFGSDPKLKNPDCVKTSFPTKDVRAAHPDLFDAVQQLMTLFQDEKPNRRALATGRKTLALHRFAQAFLPEFDRLKQIRGWLDFDDLILKARALLSSSTMAQWVLFKLDGGIDHILVDEAQDTSPAQWAVIARLAEEFSTGESARDVARTLFVVGDEKQSIYSFQGADPAAFAQMRGHFQGRLNAAGESLNRHDLLYSFRSSTTILRLVDTVLHNDGGNRPEVTHRAFHGDLPGRVDLWPFLPKPEKAEKAVWYEPLDVLAPNDPSLALAARIADAIKGILDRGEALPTTKGSRKITAGDFLILVQRRSGLFHEIIRALKDRDLPVAGADRLKIGGELAVRDLSAVLSFMATPEDDLSLAAALRSPLFRLSEGDLFHLAYGRKGYLWPELRKQKARFAEAFAILDDLLAKADFQRPYELIERILTHHKGREYLIARLGKEAEDGIDALLLQALQYEQLEPPSLTGFLGWMDADESDIKRQMGGQSREIRVMTVHGAKGLESPIVILPDTARRNPPQAGEIVVIKGGLAVWKPAQADSPALVREALDARRTFLQQERGRLLYVALTRAQNWLIICGAGDVGKNGASWYSQIDQALEGIGAETVTFQGHQIRRFAPLVWDMPAGNPTPARDQRVPDVPDWARRPAPPAPLPALAINPSNLGGAKVVENPQSGLDEPAALRRGTRIHALLEHLSAHAPADWPHQAGRILASLDGDTGDLAALLKEVGAVLSKPAHAPLFAPGTLAEVGITARIKNTPLDGIIDRLVILPDRVLAVDFKSNADVPDDARKVPEGILRQMGAYAAALGEIYPDHAIETAILWTKTATLMPLSHEAVTDALNRATAS